MQFHLKNNINKVNSSDYEASNPDIISDEEKELLDLFSEFLFKDILNDIKQQQNEI